MTATISGVTGALLPTGSVTVTDGTTTVGTGSVIAGKATISVTLQSLGSHTLTAQYSGDSNYVRAAARLYLGGATVCADVVVFDGFASGWRSV